MASELKPWRYKIKYGPEGEDAYSWVYDDHGAMVATMKTHKAKQIVDAMNTRPELAATDTGLETVAKLGGINGVMLLRHIENLRPEAQAAYKDELVRRSQAVELLAAEREKKTEIENAWLEAIVSISELKANNAAKDARIKELEAGLENGGRVKGVNTQYANALAYLEMTEDDDPEEFAKRLWDEREALEAKLAAAEKALEHLTLHANSLALADIDRTRGRTGFWQALKEARAVLGRKPS